MTVEMLECGHDATQTELCLRDRCVSDIDRQKNSSNVPEISDDSDTKVETTQDLGELTDDDWTYIQNRLKKDVYNKLLFFLET